MTRRRSRTAATTAVVLAGLVLSSALAGCAPSNATKNTSFTSLDRAATQAQAWVDAAVATADPSGSPGR